MRTDLIGKAILIVAPIGYRNPPVARLHRPGTGEEGRRELIGHRLL
jgi:hypothetical protein